MATVIVTNRDFVVAEQYRSNRWIAHVFEDREHFVSWRQAHPEPVIVDRRTARGRQMDTEDHRWEVRTCED